MADPGAAGADHDGHAVRARRRCGDVIGDLNGRRGRPQGMEPIGAMTEIKAEVPMAEMLTYAPDLRSITAGQGDYTLEFLRYEEVPGHLAQKVVEPARSARRTPRRTRRTSGGRRSPGNRRRGPGTLTDDGDPHDRHVAARCRLRALRPPAAARRAARGVPRRRPAPHGLRALRPARRRRGLVARAATARPADAIAAPDARGARSLERCSTRLPRRPRRGPQESPGAPSLAPRPAGGARRRRQRGVPDPAAAGEPWPRSRAFRSRRRRRSRAPRPGGRRFNASEYPRRVAGVTRSLGEPAVSVVPAEHLVEAVRIIVAWELCWYRYEVDPGEAPVCAQAVGQGTELDQLSPRGARRQRPVAGRGRHAGARAMRLPPLL